MSDPRMAYRDALAEYHRRRLQLAAPGFVAAWALFGLFRGRDAWARRDYPALVGLAASASSAALTQTVSYRRAEAQADTDLAREEKNRALRRWTSEQHRTTTGWVEVPIAAMVPAERTPVGCLAPLALLTAGWAQATWDFYRHHPDRHRPVAGPRWALRPGPAWWTAWSAQQLPVNSASRAPRAAQIAYQRRQALTFGATGLAAEAITVWETQARPALTAQDRPRLAAAVVRLATRGLSFYLDYTRVPARVDAARARRRRHAAAVAALHRARAVGGPRPANPHRLEIALSSAGAAVIAASFTAAVVEARNRPKPPEPPRPPRPKPPASKRPPLAA